MQDARSALQQVVSGFIELRASPPLAQAALELGAELDHPGYDCAYVVLAEAEAAAFLTADRQLVEVVLARRPTLHAHWVAEDNPSAR